MKLMRIGVDLAKNVFQIHGVDCHELNDQPDPNTSGCFRSASVKEALMARQR